MEVLANGGGMPLLDAAALPFLGLGSESAVHQLGDVLPDGLFMTDVAGRVTYWNRAAERITGWKREEAVGRDCSILAGDSVRGCACGLGPIRCGMVERERTSKTCNVRARDGRLLLIVKSAVPLFAPSGEPVGALETFTEVSAEHPGQRAEAPVEESRELLGRAPSMLELDRMIKLVAWSDATVMILGESGTGKERVAEAVHAASPWASGPFTLVACSGLDDAAEAELIAQLNGSGSTAAREGLAGSGERNRGTLVLDEVADLTPLIQLRFLRALEEREKRRGNPARTAACNMRLVCTSHRDLKSLVEAGRFRADLYFRLAVFPLRVPPLRDRPGDVGLIGEAFLNRRLPTPDGHPRQILRPALAALEACPWAGNVRELQSVLEFAALQAGNADIDLGHLPPDVRALAPGASSEQRAAAMPDRGEILAALEASGGNRAAAARRLGISRVTLWKRLKDEGQRG
jgi:two-component system response regulator HydG